MIDRLATLWVGVLVSFVALPLINAPLPWAAGEGCQSGLAREDGRRRLTEQRPSDSARGTIFQPGRRASSVFHAVTCDDRAADAKRRDGRATSLAGGCERFLLWRGERRRPCRERTHETPTRHLRRRSRRARVVPLRIRHTRAPTSEARAALVAPDYPLQRGAVGTRYLVDQQGAPFFWAGDAAWSLIAQVNQADAEQYLDDRKARGFNVVMVNLIENAFSTNPPANVHGAAPFTGRPFATPNEAHFAHADAVIEAAAQRDINVLLAPIYLAGAAMKDGVRTCRARRAPKCERGGATSATAMHLSTTSSG